MSLDKYPSLFRICIIIVCAIHGRMTMLIEKRQNQVLVNIQSVNNCYDNNIHISHTIRVLPDDLSSSNGTHNTRNSGGGGGIVGGRKRIRIVDRASLTYRNRYYDKQHDDEYDECGLLCCSSTIE